MAMRLRDYTAQDKAACLALFDSNLDPYFQPQERPDYSEFLDKYTDSDYFVVEADDGAVVACGGVAVNPTTGGGALTWGMVDRSRQKQGIGQFLTVERLKRLRQNPLVKFVRIQTSQHTEAFYARQGFKTHEIIENGFGEGLHNYIMILEVK